MLPSLAGNVVLVTGASRGIGRAAALRLAREGARLALVARREDQLAEVAGLVREAGSEALPLVCDAADPAAIAAAVARCVEVYGRLDALVNNAGAFLEAPITDIALADWNYVLQVNVTAPFLFCQAALPIMQRQRSGRIVNIASTAGTKGYLYQSAYCTSKHALLGFARCLALEAKPHGIHVVTLCPGGVRTGFVGDGHLADRLAGQAMIEPEDMAEWILFALQQPDNLDTSEIVIERCHRG